MGTIRGYGKDRTCIFCNKEKEGIDIAFEDGSFVGFLCFVDFKRAMKMRSGGVLRREEPADGQARPAAG